MSRPKTEPTTGKRRTDPPPYFLHDRSDRFYDVLETEIGKYVARLKRQIHPPLKNKHLLLATAAGRRPEQSAFEAVAVPVRKDLGIGPVRAVYYRELVHGHYFREMMAHTYFAGRSHFVVGNRYRDPMEWLCGDRYLAKTLMSLGLSWWKVEWAMVQAIRAAGLPEKFMRQYGSSPDIAAVWEQTLSNREAYAREGDATRRYSRHARELRDQGETGRLLLSILSGTARDVRTDVDLEVLEDGLLRFTSPTNRDRIINALIAFDGTFPAGIEIAASDRSRLEDAAILRDYALHSILQDSKDLAEPDSDEFPLYRSVRKSPLINAVIFGVGCCIWNHINIERMPINKAARRLVERNRAWREQGTGARFSNYLPDEFYMLLADLLYHCPIICGVPDDHLMRSAIRPHDDDRPKPPMWDGLTADAVRQRFGKMYRKACPVDDSA